MVHLINLLPPQPQMYVLLQSLKIVLPSIYRLLPRHRRTAISLTDSSIALCICRVGIALGFVLVAPTHPLLKMEIVVSHHLSPADAGYCVLLYVWLLVSG